MLAYAHLRTFLWVAMMSYERFSDRWAGDSLILRDRVMGRFRQWKHAKRFP